MKHFSQYLLVLGLTLAFPLSVIASSHREAPLTSIDPTIDQTDLYAFISPQDTNKLVLAGNWNPFGVAGAGPNYYRFDDQAYYAFHVDNDGDAVEEVSYVIKFKTEVADGMTFLFNKKPITRLSDANVRQTYTVYRIDGEFTGKRKDRQFSADNIVLTGEVATPVIGSKSIANYGALAKEAITTRKGVKAFAGPRDDPFFADLNVFDLLNLGQGIDSLAGTNVQSIVLEVRINDLTAGDSVVGVWGATYRRNVVFRKGAKRFSYGPLSQVSRLGMPLVNEVVVPLDFKDYFNSSHPKLDADTAAYSQVVLNPELARLFVAVLGLEAPTTDRQDLVTVFLTGVPGLNQPKKVRAAEMLRVNTDIKPVDKANRLGVFGDDTAGFPNGRRLEDDVIDIAIQAVAGKLVDGYEVSAELGDGVNTNDKVFLKVFPYLAPPHGF